MKTCTRLRHLISRYSKILQLNAKTRPHNGVGCACQQARKAKRREESHQVKWRSKIDLRTDLVWLSWQRPTLPHSLPCSTIGAYRLNFRVRNGTGCTPVALVTNKLCSNFSLLRSAYPCASLLSLFICFATASQESVLTSQ